MSFQVFNRILDQLLEQFPYQVCYQYCTNHEKARSNIPKRLARNSLVFAFKYRVVCITHDTNMLLMSHVHNFETLVSKFDFLKVILKRVLFTEYTVGKK